MPAGIILQNIFPIFSFTCTAIDMLSLFQHIILFSLLAATQEIHFVIFVNKLSLAMSFNNKTQVGLLCSVCMDLLIH